MNYRKKPVVIQAEQFHVDMSEPWPFGIVKFHAACDQQNGPAGCFLDGKHYVETLEGPLIVSDGDWIICGIKGEFYPCKPDIFEATYEPVEPETP